MSRFSTVTRSRWFPLFCLLAVLATTAVAAGLPGVAPAAAAAGGGLPWWGWPLLLFAVSFLLGVVAVPAGVGGGVLFVPIVSGFFPFHLDFVRGTGLLVALAGSLSASPGLLRCGLADLRLAMPAALAVSMASIGGALVGLALPAAVVQTSLGVTILGIVALLLIFRKSDYPTVEAQGRLAAALRFQGAYHEESSGAVVTWRAHRASRGLLLFLGIGFLAGLFGLGAGWANVPVLNLVMGAPLKLAVGTSMFLLSASGAPAAWVYIHQGAVLPLLAVPSMLGMMLGSQVGGRVLKKVRPAAIRHVVWIMLLLAGMRALLKGLGLWP